MESAQLPEIKQMNDITECPECSKPFTDARSLPCVHTFCLKCIAGHSPDKQPGDKMPCPVCAKDFTIPVGTGMNGLTKNLFVEKLLFLKQKSNNQETSPCEACDTAARNDTEKPPASTTYCAECQQKFCDCCARVHENYRPLRSHKLIPLRVLKGPRGEEIFSTSMPTTCEKHQDRALDIFCENCKTVVCISCHIASNKQHNYLSIQDASVNFRKKLATNMDSLTDCVGKLERILANVQRLKKELHKKASDTEDAVLQKASELQKRIEENKQALTSKLTTKKRDIEKRFDDFSSEITRQILLIEGLKKYIGELSNKGAAADVAREITIICDRTEELLNTGVIEWSRNHMESLNVSLATSALTTGNSENLIGEVVVQVIPKGGDIDYDDKVISVLSLMQN